MTIFDFIESDSPCDNCVFYVNGCCDHEADEYGWCVDGSFQVTYDMARCPQCGKQVTINQSPFGSDGGICTRCGVHLIFRNKGNRMGWLEAYRKGLVIAS